MPTTNRFVQYDVERLRTVPVGNLLDLDGIDYRAGRKFDCPLCGKRHASFWARELQT